MAGEKGERREGGKKSHLSKTLSAILPVLRNVLAFPL